MGSTAITEDLSITSRVTRARRAFRQWRWQRPFWAGTFTLLSGLPIMYFPYARMQFGDLTIRMSTTAGAGSLVIGILLVTLGLTMWFQPATRVFSGVATLVLVLVSLVVSNFGGFILGYLFGLFGGGMSIAWMPAKEDTTEEPGGDIARLASGGAAVKQDDTAVLPFSAAGTGSALAGFSATTTKEQGKGKHRAE